MSAYEHSGKRIAKNTLLLYGRMIVIMLVTIYTSRVVLDKLGTDDYALYHVVAGVIGMLAFLNNTLSIGTSRFLTFSLGKGDPKGLKETFNTAFYTHLVLALIVIIILETVGLWFLNNKLVIPDDRLFACRIVYQISILTTLINITQVPYTSTIIAHERMNIYAYLSILEAVLKLLIVYLLTIANADKLIFYASLVAGVQLLVAMLYRAYCIKNFSESKLQPIFNKSIFKDLMDYSGWNIIANISEAINHSGLPIILNLFFQPFVVAAQSLATQVTHALMQFITNFRTAINPQIIKLYAAGDYEGSRKLTLTTTVYVFDLLLLLCLPCIAIMGKLMDLWLVDVPEYAVIFAQFAIARCIIGCFSASFYIPMMAAGKLKSNSLASLIITITQYGLLLALFKLGFGVMWMQYIAVLVSFSYSFIVKPLILRREIGYNWKEMISCYKECFKNGIIPIIVTVLCMIFIPQTNFGYSILIALIIAISVVISTWMFLDAAMKQRVISMVKSKLHRQ